MATKKSTPAAKTTTKKAAPKATTTKAAKPAEKKAPAPKAATSKAVTEEMIRRKADELYHARVKAGKTGSPEEDWAKAEKALKAAKK